MFFWEDDIDESIIRNEGSLESRGNYSPHNLDINWTFFNVFNERSYSRWRFHFFLVSSVLTLISLYYPIIFIIVFFDLSVWFGSSVSDCEWMTEDYFYDYTLYVSQIRGGDARLNIYVFVTYDRLGYVIYGLSEIGVDYCDDLFEYNYLLGLNDYIKTYTFIQNLDPRADDNLCLSVKNLDNILNHREKYYYYYKADHLINLNSYNSNIHSLLNESNSSLNYRYYFNNDRSLSWTEFNELRKKIGS